jgi:hypothetical protein
MKQVASTQHDIRSNLDSFYHLTDQEGKNRLLMDYVGSLLDSLKYEGEYQFDFTWSDEYTEEVFERSSTGGVVTIDEYHNCVRNSVMTYLHTDEVELEELLMVASMLRESVEF